MYDIFFFSRWQIVSKYAHNILQDHTLIFMKNFNWILWNKTLLHFLLNYKIIFTPDQSTNLFYHNNGRMKSQILLGHVDVVVKKGETNFRCCCFYDFTWIFCLTQMFPLKSHTSWVTLLLTLRTNIH